MFRAVVTFLVSLPLLMPPGMCICQFAPKERASTAAGARAAGLVTAESGGRAACSHCRSKSKAAHRDGCAERTGVTTDGCPHPSPTHAPGCPALKSVDQSKVAGQVFTVDGPLALAADAPGLVEPPTPVPAGFPVDAAPAAHKPLYITFRTLLI